MVHHTFFGSRKVATYLFLVALGHTHISVARNCNIPILGRYGRNVHILSRNGRNISPRPRNMGRVKPWNCKRFFFGRAKLQHTHFESQWSQSTHFESQWSQHKSATSQHGSRRSMELLSVFFLLASALYRCILQNYPVYMFFHVQLARSTYLLITYRTTMRRPTHGPQVKYKQCNQASIFAVDILLGQKYLSRLSRNVFFY